MKKDWEKKYAQIAFWVCLVILFTVICVFFFLNYNDFGLYLKKVVDVLKPIIYGVVIAYVLNKIMKLYEGRVFRFLDKKPGRMRMKRTFSLVATYFTAVAIIAGFIWLIVPQVLEGINDLRDNVPMYIKAFEKWLDGIAGISVELYDIIIKGLNYISGIYGALDEIVETLMPKVTDWLSNILSFLTDLIIGIILSVYFLVQKEKFLAQGKRLARAVFSDAKYENTIVLMKNIDNSFGGYLVAMGVDSFLVMLEGMVLFGLAGIPYYTLIGLIVGVTNFIPFFGPFIGAIPSAIIILISDPYKVIPFVLLVLLIQQIDGNIIAPKIIGNHIGISSVWVVIAVTVMSGLFGFVGMVIGVPLFSVIYTLVDNAIGAKLGKKNFDTEIFDFYSDDSMGKTIEIEMMQSRERKARKIPLMNRLAKKIPILEPVAAFFNRKKIDEDDALDTWDAITVQEIIDDFNANPGAFCDEDACGTDETDLRDFYADENDMKEYDADGDTSNIFYSFDIGDDGASIEKEENDNNN